MDDSFDEDYLPSPSDLMDYDSDFSSSESDVIPFHNKKDQKGYNKWLWPIIVHTNNLNHSNAGYNAYIGYLLLLCIYIYNNVLI